MPLPPTTRDTIRCTAIVNLVIVVEFFSLTINAFFTILIYIGVVEGSILGPVSDYTTIIESNSQSILYSYSFI